MQLTDHLDAVLGDLSRLVAGTRPDQLGDATPCANFTVRDLISHLVGGGHMFAAGFRGEKIEVPDGPTPDLVGDDPSGALKGAVTAFTTAIRAPGAMERTVTLPFGDMPAPLVVNLATFDLFVHAADLARATGQSFSPAPEIVTLADAFARQVIADSMRNGDTFAAEITVPADASPLDKLLAFTGRKPG